MIEFIRGIRTLVSRFWMPASARISSIRVEFPIPISDRIVSQPVCVLQVHHGILHRLDDPARGRVRGGSQDTDAPAGVLDDCQDLLALSIEGDGLDEIAGQKKYLGL
ncbi:hypothetical protein AB0H34_18345 [Saccharopolyspora shandongensis]|uniref:hypothetical protein n=1 Tax=Saccharopolyspora shandongensis TaxID=418495 RepID=UPI00340D73AB